ncbi:MAG: hypothetical protein ACMXYC_01540 [Candidatus Woesearchaeota archaeon]
MGAKVTRLNYGIATVLDTVYDTSKRIHNGMQENKGNLLSLGLYHPQFIPRTMTGLIMANIYIENAIQNPDLHQRDFIIASGKDVLSYINTLKKKEQRRPTSALKSVQNAQRKLTERLSMDVPHPIGGLVRKVILSPTNDIEETRLVDCQQLDLFYTLLRGVQEIFPTSYDQEYSALRFALEKVN